MNVRKKHALGEKFVLNETMPLDSPLGRILFAGTKWNSQATYGHAPPPDYLRPTIHYLLVYTLEGEADYFDDTGVRTILREGTLIWAVPNINQSYGPRPGWTWSEFYMWFDGPVFDTWQRQGIPGERTRVLSLKPVRYWTERFTEVVKGMKRGEAETPVMRLCRLQQFLAEALQAQEKNEIDLEMSRWKEKASQLLTSGDKTTPSLDAIARRLNMSYSLFRKRFTHLTGKTPGQYKSEWIMRKACSRLLETNEPLSRIAEDLGFHDQFHFSKRFKLEMGITPSVFRRQVQ